MSISDRLSEIRARIIRARAGRHTDRHLVLDVDAPALVEAVRAVLDLHTPVTRFLVDGFEEVSYLSRERAVEKTECDPRAVTEWTLCDECRRVEDGVDGEGPRQSGYINADYPCPTVRAVEAALGEES